MDIWMMTFELALSLILLTALGAALLGRTGQRWLYWLLLTPWVLGLSGLWCVVTVFLAAIVRDLSHPTYVGQSLCLALLLTAGGVSITILGNRSRDGRVVSAAWPAWRLFVACVAAAMLQTVTFHGVNAAICREAIVTRERSGQEYAALLRPVEKNESNAAGLYNDAFAQIAAKLDAADVANEQRFYSEITRWNAQNSAATTAEIDDETTAVGPVPTTKPSQLLLEANIDEPQMPPLIQSLEPAVQMLRITSLRPRCRFNQSNEPPTWEDKQLWLNSFRKAVMVLRCHAALEARLGRLDSAVEDIATIRRITPHISQTVVGLVPYLVASSCDNVADQALADVVPYASKPVRLPHGPGRTASGLREELRVAFTGEESITTRAALDFCDGQPVLSDLHPIPPRAAVAYRTLYLRSDLAAIHQLFNAARDRVDGKAIPAAWAHTGRPASGLLGRILMLSPWKAVRVVLPQREACSAAANVALALTEYRIVNGHYPASLDELIPKYLVAVPADPFDGKPMRYVLKDGEAMIYSVGENRLDDGGQLGPRHSGFSWKTLDVGLALKKLVTPANPS